MLNIVIALDCEARPIISHFGMKSVGGSNAFRIYQNDTTHLIISGVGKVSAAAAVAYLQGRYFDRRDAAWLNIGIAGHKVEPLGKGIQAYKIIDHTTGKTWYPPISKQISGGTVLTVDKEVTHYENNTFYDMEAAGFFAAATHFSTLEIIQSYKVVSDNSASPIENIKKATVEKHITDNIENISELSQHLDKLSEELSTISADPEYYDTCITNWHFTAYQRNQLRQLLTRLQARDAGQDIWNKELKQLKKASEVIKYLQQYLKTTPFCLID